MIASSKSGPEPVAPLANPAAGGAAVAKPALGKVLIMGVVVMALLAIVYLSPLRGYLARWYWQVKDYVLGLTPESSDAEFRTAAPSIPVFRLAAIDAA